MHYAMQNAKHLTRELDRLLEPLARAEPVEPPIFFICIIGHIQKDRFAPSHHRLKKYLS